MAVELSLAGECRAHRGEFLLFGGVDFRVGKPEVFHRMHDRGGDDEPGKPLVVGGHDKPWRLFGRGCPDRFLERAHVIVPKLTFLHIGWRKFPGLLRLVEARDESLLLLVARDVKEELQNFRPLPRRVVLEMRDVGEPLIPDALADERRRQLLRLEDSGCTRTTRTSS